MFAMMKAKAEAIMPVLTWFERAALLLSGYAMMRPTWRTYKEEGIRPAARSLI